MVHKIWDKDPTEKEGASVRDHLANCYDKLYIADEDDNQERGADITANNLIQ